MQIGNRFRCYPTPAQQKTLLQWIGCQLFICNAKVSEDRYFRSFARRSLAHVGKYAPVDQHYSHFKNPELTPWLSDVPSQLLRNATVLWKKSYARFFEGLGGRPAIHTKNGKQSAWLTSELFSFETKTDTDTGKESYVLRVGTQRHPLGTLDFTAHRS